VLKTKKKCGKAKRVENVCQTNLGLFTKKEITSLESLLTIYNKIIKGIIFISF